LASLAGSFGGQHFIGKYSTSGQTRRYTLLDYISTIHSIGMILMQAPVMTIAAWIPPVCVLIDLEPFE
jgi:hypothetical protein